MGISTEELMRIGGQLKVVNDKPPIKTSNETKARTDFWQTLAQGVAKPFLKTGLAGYQGAKGAIGLATGKKEWAEEAGSEFDFGYFGKVRPAGVDEKGEAHKTLGAFSRDVVGTGLEIGSNFMGGTGGVKAGGQLLKGALGSAVKTGVKTGAISGGLVGAGTSLQEGKDAMGVSADTVVGAGAGAVLGGALGATGVGLTAIATPIKTLTTKVAPAMQKVANKIETSIIKPLGRDMEKGFKSENIFKHNLAGTLSDTYEKSTAKLAELRNQARALREGKEKVIDIAQVVDETTNELVSGKFKSFGVGARLENVVENFVKEFEMIAPDGRLTVPQAQEIKEALGTLGSWFYGQRDLDANAQQRVANILYTKVKEAIEKNSRPGLKEINRQMGEIIPIKNAVVRRIPVAERNNIFSLTDVLSAGFALQNPKSWGLYILNKLSKSGKFAEMLDEGAKTLKNLKAPDSINLYKKKPGMSIEDVSLKGSGAIRSTTDDLTSTIQKAKADGKSFDEFVKNNIDDYVKTTKEYKDWAKGNKNIIEAYHGTPYSFDKFEIGKKQAGLYDNQGISFAPNPELAESFSRQYPDWYIKKERELYKKYPNVDELLKKEEKILEAGDIEKVKKSLDFEKKQLDWIKKDLPNTASHKQAISKVENLERKLKNLQETKINLKEKEILANFKKELEKLEDSVEGNIYKVYIKGKDIIDETGEELGFGSQREGLVAKLDGEILRIKDADTGGYIGEEFIVNDPSQVFIVNSPKNKSQLQQLWDKIK